MTGINIKCSAPKLIKSEVIAAKLPKDENITEINEDQIKKVLEKLQSGKEVDEINLNELMSSLQKNNTQSNIDLGQLQGLLQSQSFLGQLAKGDLFDKLSSEEFLKMIVDEFNKLTKSRNTLINKLSVIPRNWGNCNCISATNSFNYSYFFI